MSNEHLQASGHFTEGVCKKCGGELRPSKAIVCKTTGMADFAGDTHACTVSPDPRQPVLVDCLKCTKCGWSVTPINNNE